jgi:hypothetical protein
MVRTSEHDLAQVDTSPASAIERLATGFWVSQALYVAAKLGIADLLYGGAKSSEVVAAAVGAHAGALHRVLRALASFGVFAEEEGGRFRNTPMSEALRTGVPNSTRDFVIMLGESESWRSWGDVLHSVRTGEPAFEHVFGSPLFHYMANNRDAALIFDNAMTSRSAGEIEAVLAAYDFSRATNVVDVGGGRGALLEAILNTYPHINGVLFDQSHVIEGARASIRTIEEASRCRFAEGDFFIGEVPLGGDVYLLKKVIHDWDDEHARIILQGCSRAMTAKARLLLIEPVVPSGNGPSFAKLLDLFMLVWPGGRERTEDEHHAVLVSAGFDLIQIIPTKSSVSIIEARAR